MRHDSKRECETNRNSKCRTAAPPQGGRTKVCTSNGTSPSPRPSLQDARTQRAPHALAGHIQGVIMAASTVREVGNHCERVTGGAKGSDAPVRAGVAYLLMYVHLATCHRGENSLRRTREDTWALMDIGRGSTTSAGVAPGAISMHGPRLATALHGHGVAWPRPARSPAQ